MSSHQIWGNNKTIVRTHQATSQIIRYMQTKDPHQMDMQISKSWSYYNPISENKDWWACLLLNFGFPFQRLPNQPMLFCAVVIRWKGGQVEVCTGLWHPLCPCNGCIQIYLRHNSLSVGRYKACVNWINVNDKIAKAKSLLDPSAKILQMTLPRNFIRNIYLIINTHWL